MLVKQNKTAKFGVDSAVLVSAKINGLFEE
jgi:hypothetical protein